MFQLGSELLRTLEKRRLLRDDETVKGIGWFLVCIGESLEKGCLLRARDLRRSYSGSEMPPVKSLAIGFCLLGDQIMDWSAGIYHQEKGNEPSEKSKTNQTGS